MRRIIAAVAVALIVIGASIALTTSPAGAEGTYAPAVEVGGVRIVGLARNASCSITRTFVSTDGKPHRIETNQRDHWTRSSGADVPAGGQVTIVVNGDYVAPYLVSIDGGPWVDLQVPDHGDSGKDCGDASSTSTTSTSTTTPSTTTTAPPDTVPPTTAPPTTPAPPATEPPATSIKAPPTPSTSPSTEVTLPATGGRGSGTAGFGLLLVVAGVAVLVALWRADAGKSVRLFESRVR